MDEIFLCRDLKELQELSRGSEYEVESDDTLLIPFGSLHHLTLINESEREENLALSAFPYRLDVLNEENEPLFVKSCLENLENERVGKKTRKIYGFDFKRISLPGSLNKKQYETLETGKTRDTDERFLEFLPKVPKKIKQELREITSVSFENPLELAFKVHNWTRENFKVEDNSAKTLSELLEERKNKKAFFGDCLEYGRVFSNVMRAYDIPTTIITGKHGYHYGGHVWSEICIPVKSEESYKTLFLPVDASRDKFGNIEKEWLYFAYVPFIQRKTFWGKKTVKKSLKLVYS